MTTRTFPEFYTDYIKQLAEEMIMRTVIHGDNFTMFNAEASVAPVEVLDLTEDDQLIPDNMTRDELITELSDLQLDYEDSLDQQSEYLEEIEELELDILELEAENAQLRYDLALSQRANSL